MRTNREPLDLAVKVSRCLMAVFWPVLIAATILWQTAPDPGNPPQAVYTLAFIAAWGIWPATVIAMDQMIQLVPGRDGEEETQ